MARLEEFVATTPNRSLGQLDQDEHQRLVFLLLPMWDRTPAAGEGVVVGTLLVPRCMPPRPLSEQRGLQTKQVGRLGC